MKRSVLVEVTLRVRVDVSTSKLASLVHVEAQAEGEASRAIAKLLADDDLIAAIGRSRTLKIEVPR